VNRHLAAMLLITASVAHAFAATPTDTAGEQRPALRLTNGESSVERLVERFRRALIDKDKQALRALRVTQDEYVEIIMAGGIDPGQPRGSDYSEQAKQYFWGVLNGRSIYTEANLLAEYGGHPFKVTDVTYRKGVKQYADYRAYKQLELTLEDDAGRVDRLRIGSIAEIDGQFKFISYVRD